MSDDLPVPAPELPGQLPMFPSIPVCDAPGCAWSAGYGAVLAVPDGDLAVVHLCADHFPAVDGPAVRSWPIA